MAVVSHPLFSAYKTDKPLLEKIKAHPLIPQDCKVVFAHSNFGNEVGYAHCVTADEIDNNLYLLALELGERHAGAPGRGHGAVSLAMLDEIMGRAASRAVNNLCYTASMTTNFCNASKVGDFLLASARVRRAGKSMVFVDSELHSGETLVATATATFANSGRPIPFTGTTIDQ